MPVECAFQGSKVFANGGPFVDLYQTDPGRAKRDPRLVNSGALTKFNFQGTDFPVEPKTVFYDWLYISCIQATPRLIAYDGFTDIEFNPVKSINCQARSLALYVSLTKRGLLQDAMKSPQSFVETLQRFDYHPQLRSSATPNTQS